SYTVRLYFIEPSGAKPGERVFSVKLQDREVLKDFDIAAAAGGPMRGIAKEFKGIRAGASLAVVFVPKKSTAAVSGIEVLSEAAGSIPPEVHNRVVEAPVGKAVPVTLSYRDVDGPGPFTFKITKAPAKGSVSGRGPDFAYTARQGVFGEDSFAWTVNDGLADSHEATVTVRLLAPNVPPAAKDLEVHATSGKPVTVVLPFDDPDMQPGNNDRFELVKQPAHGTLQWESYNRFLYTPEASFAGTDSFTWKANDGRSDSNLATATLLVKPDSQGPEVGWVDSAGPNDRIKIVFTETVTGETAENASNYAIDNGVTVTGAKLGDDGKSVTLTTSELPEGKPCTLSVKNIHDRAARPNAIQGDTRVRFTHVHVGSGLQAEYYQGKDFSSRLIGKRVDPYIEVDWRRELPFPNMEKEAPYSVRWTGRLKADHTEEYTLYFFKGWEHNRNPARVWLDGKLLANGEYGPVSLEAGRTYDLKVELTVERPTPYADYYSLRWSSLSTPKQTIPQSNLGVVRAPSGP
ncbi:MAG: Ig-like domain-containing protein, partial [Planctomycetota bacterium]